MLAYVVYVGVGVCVCVCCAADVMGEILRFEADRRDINITINSLGTELRKVRRLDTQST